jgi:branched-subunit amino acid transport protein
MPLDEFLLVAGMMVATVAIRAVPIALSGRMALSDRVVQLLRYVPPVVLTAIVVPAVLMPDGALWVSGANPRLIGAIAAIAIGLWRQNLLLTIILSMVVFLGWQAMLEVMARH